MYLRKFPEKILWLASYPKSGNTWFRTFLTALIKGGDVEINELATDGMFSARFFFDYFADFESSNLYDHEAKTMIADIYRNFVSGREELSVIKIHDAFDTDTDGNNIVPAEVTHCAIYFIRNPLDIAGSLASHINADIAEAVKMLNNNDAYLCLQKDNLNTNTQFRQHLGNWSYHVNSWTNKPSFPVCVLRYEDMLTNTFATFSRALKFIGWDFPADEIARAISVTSFELLKKQEVEKGFREKLKESNSFFRSGTMGNWEKELNSDQIRSILMHHEETLKLYNYL